MSPTLKLVRPLWVKSGLRGNVRFWRILLQKSFVGLAKIAVEVFDGGVDAAHS
jgi:hypothetical protein